MLQCPVPSFQHKHGGKIPPLSVSGSVQEIREKERLVYTLSRSFRSKDEIISWGSSQGDSFHLAWQLGQLGRPEIPHNAHQFHDVET